MKLRALLFTLVSTTLEAPASDLKPPQETTVLAKSQIPQSKMGWKLWKDRFETFNTEAQRGDIELLLLGDSITHYWQHNKMCATDGQTVWDEFFADKKVGQFGIGSDRTQHLLYRLTNGNLNGIQPKAIVLMIGTNNTTSKHTPQEIYLGTRDIVHLIQEKCPDSKIFLYDIFPRIRNGQPARDNNKKASALCEALCDGKKVVHCSINNQLLNKEGSPNKTIFFDGIHLNATGYRIWALDILKELKKAKVTLQ